MKILSKSKHVAVALATAMADTTNEINPFHAYTDSQLQGMFSNAGVLPADLPRV